jgi:hypothetical protein
MQVTDAMVAAAQDATPRWMNATDSEIRHIVEAALAAAGEVAVDVTANIRIQVDETEFRSSVADAIERLSNALPRNAEGRITLATLRGATASPPHHIPVTEPRPGSTVDVIATLLGEHRSAVLGWIADPIWRFPKPVLTTGDDEHDLYDLDAVKAWYDALPQAADG